LENAEAEIARLRAKKEDSSAALSQMHELLNSERKALKQAPSFNPNTGGTLLTCVAGVSIPGAAGSEG
jgi:hypothetical protein